MTELKSYIRRPRTSQPKSLTAQQVAKAYNLPTGFTGKGALCGIIELGGGFGPSDLRTYFGTSVPVVTAIEVAGGTNTSDGPNGADGEVLLDIEVAASVAPGAKFNVYFCPNTDDGFLAGIQQAIKDGCDAISISWGQAENQWASSSLKNFDGVFAAAKAQGVNVFVAAGDSGADDSTGKPVTDFPASSPNVVGCGGTRLTVTSAGARDAEVTWDDDDTSSATGGGASKVFPGRDVPDVAGNADPDSGYEVVVDGERAVIGGTSAVAPLYAGMSLVLKEANGGQRFDFQQLVTSNPSICFDVTAGDNGAYRAGPGRDEVTGFGVVDATRALAALKATAAPIPAPTPTPAPPTPTPAPVTGATFPGATDAVDRRIASAAARAKESTSDWMNHHFDTYFKISS